MFSQSMPTGSLVGYWPFDGNANDLSSNNNHGTVSNATPAHDRFGNPNMAYKFNGTTAKITVPHSPSLLLSGSDDMTFAFWVKSYTVGFNAICVEKHQSGSWNGFMFFLNCNNSSYCTSPHHMSMYVAANSQGDACSDAPVSADSTWRFVTGVYTATANTVKLYVNAALQSDIGVSSGPIGNTEDLVFGSLSENLQHFTGVIDGVRMYKRVLSDPEILTLYNEPNPTLSVNELTKKSVYISVLPNPNNGVFKVQLKNAFLENPRIEIYNQLGQKVYENNMLNNELTLNERFANGVYIIHLIEKNTVIGTQKITVQN